MTDTQTTTPVADQTDHELADVLAPLEWEYETALSNRRTYLTPVIGTFQATTDPVLLQRGRGQYLFDANGKRYIDLVGQNLSISVGYANRFVDAAVRRQLDDIQHVSTMWMHPAPAALAKSLIDKMPPGDWVVHLLSTGSEAIELAILMARVYTGRHTIMALSQAFHGAAGATAMAATAISRFHQRAAGASGIVHVTNPDQYHGIHGAAVEPYLDEFRTSVASSTNGEIAAFMYEPVQGYGGVMPLPSDYVRQAIELARSIGGVVIADVVQTGFGRTGEHFYGFEEHDVVPDMVVMAKGMGNGFPLAGVIVRRDIAEAMTDRVFMSTMGSNPVCSAAGRGVLAAIEQEGLQENAKRVGAHALARFKELQERYEVIGDVRGRGLMIGVELVKDRETRAPAPELTTAVADALSDGVLVSKSGAASNVLRMVPPMCLTSKDVDEVIERYDAALKRLT